MLVLQQRHPRGPGRVGVFGQCRLVLVAAALLMGVSYRKSGKTGLGNFSLALGVLMLLGVVPSISLRGLGELILWIEQMMWILLVSFLLLEESAS